MKKNSLIIVFIALLSNGCEKIVDLKYKDNSARIVITGNVTNEAGPYFVSITKSVRLTETGAYPTVDNAVVTINDDAGNSETLTPQGNGVYQTGSLRGVAGRTYTLTVEADNQIYIAQSTLQQQVSFDSIKVEQVAFAGETEYNLVPVYTDPVAKGNNYRFVLVVNGKLINQHLLQNDEVRNGLVNTFRLEINSDDLTLKSGDQISLTMQCVDEKVGLYYQTLALMGDSGPGGGTTPTNPPNNISNGALGLFSACTAETKTVTLP